MKRILILISVFAVVTGAFAQVDRTKAPLPSAAREIKIGEYQTFTLKNGLQVFVVENHKLPRVQFTLELKNDQILEGTKAGFTQIAGDLLGTGTRTKTKAQLDEEIDFIGATLNTRSNGIFASSLSRHTSKLLDLVTDVLYNPAFSQEELDKLKTQSLSGIAAEKDDPNSIAVNVRSILYYGKNHPYGEIPTEKSVESVTLDDCKNYFNTWFKPNNAYLVIVGDIDLKSAKALTEKYFAKWVSGEVKNPTYTLPQAPAKTFVALVDRSASVQSVINVGYPVELRTGTPEAIQARVTNQILGVDFSSRLNQNLREKHGYTYGSGSQLTPDKLVGYFNASASVRNEVTDSSVYQLLNELKRISSEPVTDAELTAAKAFISGAFGRSLENPQTIANFALNTAKYNLPKDYYANYLKSIDAVNKDNVLATAKKYIHPGNAYIVVVGKGADVADKLKQFGEVKYYDINGDVYTPQKASALPAGLTAEKVISTYIDAIGGAKKIQEIKTAKSVMKATIQGMELTLTNSKKSPGKNLVEVSMAGNVMQKTVSDGKDFSNGQPTPVDAAEKEKSLFESQMFPETALAAFKVKTNLVGIESVEGQEAYVVEYVLPAGGKTTNYFDKTTGLKIQSVEVAKTPQGEMAIPTKYQDYKEVNGVKFPHTILISQGPMNFKFQASSFEVNKPIDDAVFKVQ